MKRITLNEFIELNVISEKEHTDMSLVVQLSPEQPEKVETITINLVKSELYSENTKFDDLQISVLDILTTHLPIEQFDIQGYDQYKQGELQRNIGRLSRRGAGNFLIEVDQETLIMVYSNENINADKIIKAFKTDTSSYQIHYSPAISKLGTIIKIHN